MTSTLLKIKKVAVGIATAAKCGCDNLCGDKAESKAIATIPKNSVAVWHIWTWAEGRQAVIVLTEGSGPGKVRFDVDIGEKILYLFLQGLDLD